MADQEVPTGLARLAARAAGADFAGFYMAVALRAYGQVEGLSEAGLAALLGLTPEGLARLALCRRPRGSDVTFRGDVQAIAAYSGASAPALVALLRRVEAMEAVGSGPAGGRGALLAAREHPTPPSTPPSPGPEEET